MEIKLTFPHSKTGMLTLMKTFLWSSFSLSFPYRHPLLLIRRNLNFLCVSLGSDFKYHLVR